MQRGLVNHWTSQESLVGAYWCNGQAVKPICPALTQVALYPDLIGHRMLWIHLWPGCFCHAHIPVMAGQNGLSHMLDLPKAYLHDSLHTETRKCCLECCLANPSWPLFCKTFL